MQVLSVYSKGMVTRRWDFLSWTNCIYWGSAWKLNYFLPSRYYFIIFLGFLHGNKPPYMIENTNISAHETRQCQRADKVRNQISYAFPWSLRQPMEVIIPILLFDNGPWLRLICMHKGLKGLMGHNGLLSSTHTQQSLSGTACNSSPLVHIKRNCYENMCKCWMLRSMFMTISILFVDSVFLCSQLFVLGNLVYKCINTSRL